MDMGKNVHTFLQTTKNVYFQYICSVCFLAVYFEIFYMYFINIDFTEILCLQIFEVCFLQRHFTES
jgi:hypothetical protein